MFPAPLPSAISRLSCAGFPGKSSNIFSIPESRFRTASRSFRPSAAMCFWNPPVHSGVISPVPAGCPNPFAVSHMRTVLLSPSRLICSRYLSLGLFCRLGDRPLGDPQPGRKNGHAVIGIPPGDIQQVNLRREELYLSPVSTGSCSIRAPLLKSRVSRSVNASVSGPVFGSFSIYTSLSPCSG